MNATTILQHNSADMERDDSEEINVGPVQTSVATSGVTVSDYECIRCTVDINRIKDPEFALRTVHEAHVTYLRGKMETMDYVSAIGSPSVIMVDHSVGRYVTENSKLDVDVLTVDGRHRLQLFKDMNADKEIDDKWETLFRALPVLL